MLRGVSLVYGESSKTLKETQWTIDEFVSGMSAFEHTVRKMCSTMKQSSMEV